MFAAGGLQRTNRVRRSAGVSPACDGSDGGRDARVPAGRCQFDRYRPLRVGIGFNISSVLRRSGADADPDPDHEEVRGPREWIQEKMI